MNDKTAGDEPRPRAMVFAASPLLTITVEAIAQGDEIHLHAGGQGFWVARMLQSLDVDPVLCGAFGGEPGSLIRSVIAEHGITVRAASVDARNGAYLHDRRSGERQEIAHMLAEPLGRHDVDDLFGLALTEGLDADVCVLAGTEDPSTIPADVFRRLAADLHDAGRTVIVDLSGTQLEAALAGGVSLAKVSEDDLRRDGHLRREDDVVTALRALHAAGARDVVITRADAPAVALLGGVVHEIRSPRMHPVDHRGAGDSFTAAAAATLARGAAPEEAMRLGGAAGALNVTRHGLASGGREEIERMADHVAVLATETTGG